MSATPRTRTRCCTRPLPACARDVARIRVWAARRLVGRARSEEVLLVVSELATNALVHASAPPGSRPGGVVLRLDAHGVEVRVHTPAAPGRVPAPRAAGTGAESGRGLALVAALADAWGIDPGPDRVRVWARFATGGA
ncbi:ATP-binding protein [Murinocardiopsis flavida]|nr:ATP-binding protein [Murinocardiopsis flavida]